MVSILGDIQSTNYDWLLALKNAAMTDVDLATSLMKVDRAVAERVAGLGITKIKEISMVRESIPASGLDSGMLEFLLSIGSSTLPMVNLDRRACECRS